MSESKARARRHGGSVFQKVPGGVWHIQYYGPHPQTGKRVCRKEYVSLPSKDAAQKELVKRLAAVGEGITVAIGRERPTVSQLFERLIRETENEERSAARPSRKSEGQRWTWAHLKPVLGYRLAEQVRSAEIEKYKTQRLDEGAAPATVNRELALLRRILRRAKQRGDLQNGLPHISLLPENNKRMNFINDAVFDRMASEAAKEGLWLRALLEVAWKYGWRRSEMVGLRVQDVDLDRRALRLDTSKNGEPREVWIDNEVLALIAPLCHGKEPDDALFTRPDGAPVRDFRAAWQNLCIRAGAPAPDKKPSRFECAECEKPIEASVAKCECGGGRRYVGLLVHDMRRSAARSLLNAGVDVIDVMNTGGWKGVSMVKRYAIFDLNASRRAMQRRIEAINPSITPSQEDALGKETTTIQ